MKENLNKIKKDISKKAEFKDMEDILEKAKIFSIFELTFNNPSIQRLQETYKYYKKYDDLIKNVYLQGLELRDKSFPEKIYKVFRDTHQTGISLKEYLDKLASPEVKEFFYKFGKDFLDIKGGATEIYKQFSCKMKSE